MNTVREDKHHFEGRIYVQPKKVLEVKKRIPVKKVNVVQIERVPVIPNQGRRRKTDSPMLTPFQSLAIDLVKSEVCERYGITVEQMECKSRIREFVIPRHLAIYISFTLQLATLNGIGSKFGNRDHATVINAKNKIDDLIFCDKKGDFKFMVKAFLDHLELRIKSIKDISKFNSNNIAQL